MKIKVTEKDNVKNIKVSSKKVKKFFSKPPHPSGKGIGCGRCSCCTCQRYADD